MTDENKQEETHDLASEMVGMVEQFAQFESAKFAENPLTSKMVELQAQIEQLKEYIGRVEDQEETIEPIDIEHLQNKIGISELIKRVEALENKNKALFISLEALIKLVADKSCKHVSLWSKFKHWMLKRGFWINPDFKE